LNLILSSFSPTKSNIEWAAEIVRAAEKAAAAGQGAWSMGTVMADAPVVAKARTILARAQQCGINLDRSGKEQRQPAGKRDGDM
jgi:citrate lyase subunit beta-like protein